MFLPRKILEEKLQKILSEDLGLGDLTTSLVVSDEVNVEAEIVAKEEGIIAGIEEAKVLMESLGLSVKTFVSDGERIRKKQVLMKISGSGRTILSAERTVLNILSRMSGIATITNKLVKKLQQAGVKVTVACTRKTAPGLLYFDKKAVQIGGGDTHRLHLDDMVLIKDNHIKIAGTIEKAVKKAREKVSFSKKVEVEISNADDVLVAVKAGADIIMLDNFSPKQIEKAVQLLKKAGLYGKVMLEASGGISAENILTFASKGVDVVSLSEITVSARTLDLSLEITKIQK